MDNEKPDIYSVPDGGLPATLDDPAYKAEELIRCEKCARQNGPNRLNCIYCGSALDVGPDAAAVKIQLRIPENWEFGWNVVIFPGEQASVRSVDVAAELLQLDSGYIRDALGLDAPFPIARLESSREAELLRDGLAALGFQTSVVGDEELLAGPPHVRLRGLSIVGGNIELRPFNDPRPIAADLSDLSLIITGSIIEAHTETIEKRKRRSRETVSELPFVSDEPILDLYFRGEQAGWRIRSGFDFSCLGDDKRLLASDNFRQLAERLAAAAPAAKLVEVGKPVRKLLDEIWQPDFQKDSRGLTRTGFRRKEMKSVTLVSNLSQFTKYSRLCKRSL